MKNLFTKVLCLVLLLVAVVSVTSCDKKSSYVYPEYNDLTTSADDAFIKIGNYTLTNKALYYYLLNNYGVDMLGDIIDDDILPELTAEQDAEFIKQLNESIYGTDDLTTLSDEEKEECLNTFYTTCYTYGLNTTDKTDKNYYETYYRLGYRRYIGTIEAYKQDIIDSDAELDEDEDPHFTEASYAEFITTNFRKDVKAYVLSFASQLEAFAFLEKAGVDTDDLNADWAIDAKALFTDNSEAYDIEGLEAITSTGSADTTIADKAQTLKAGEYTHAPQAYGTRWYLLYVDEIANKYTIEGTDYEDNDENFEHDDDGSITAVLNEDLHEVIFDLMVETELLSSDNYDDYLNKYCYEARQAKGLKVYYEGLEVAYETAFDTIYSNLSITDYESFVESDGSTECIAEWEGTKLTADDMYAELKARYGAITAFLLIRQSVLLSDKYNKVANFETHEILDEDAYAELVEDEITATKEAFEAGNFEASGYPVAYGWENFLRDYVGQLSEENIIYDFNSTLAESCEELYKEALYLVQDANEIKVKSYDAETKVVTFTCEKWAKDYTVELVNPKSGLTKDDIAVAIATVDEDIANAKNLAEDYSNGDWYYHFTMTYTNNEGSSVCVVTNEAVDQAVMEQYATEAEEAYSGSVVTIKFYFDKDLDGVADELDATDKATLQTFMFYLYTFILEEYKRTTGLDINGQPNQSSSYFDDMETIIENAIKELYINCNWLLINKGVLTSVTASTAYTQDSGLSEEFEAIVKNAINKVLEDAETYSSIDGADLDPLYRFEKDGEVYIKSASTYIANDYADNCLCLVFCTKATSNTVSGLEEGKEANLPTYYDYVQYTAGTTVDTKAQIVAYYKTAITALTTDSIVNASIIADCDDAMATVQCEYKEYIQFLINEAAKNYEK